jgi:hypothetical protein
MLKYTIFSEPIPEQNLEPPLSRRRVQKLPDPRAYNPQFRPVKKCFWKSITQRPSHS